MKYTLSSHARIRMEQRKIKPKVVRNLILNNQGKYNRADSKIGIRNAEYDIILTRDGKVITVMWRGKHKHRNNIYAQKT